MPSRTFRLTETPEPAPFAYTVAATDGFSPEAVSAQWDGSGAGGDFLPCVSYYNSDGVLLDRAFPDGVTLSSGDTAEVSYRPFKRGGGGAGASLKTTDGSATVDPTKELFVGPGLELFPFGTGGAEVIATAASSWAQGTWGALTANTGGAGHITPPLTLIAGQGFAIGGGQLIVPETGWYLAAFDGEMYVFGPRALTAPLQSQDFGVALIDVTATVFTQARTPLVVALAGGDRLVFQPAAANLLHMNANDAVEVWVINGPGAGNSTGTPGGRFGIARMV